LESRFGLLEHLHDSNLLITGGTIYVDFKGVGNTLLKDLLDFVHLTYV